MAKLLLNDQSKAQHDRMQTLSALESKVGDVSSSIVFEEENASMLSSIDDHLKEESDMNPNSSELVSLQVFTTYYFIYLILCVFYSFYLFFIFYLFYYFNFNLFFILLVIFVLFI